MTHRSASVARSASARAVSCSRRMSSLARRARMPRRPSAGFSSCASLRNASGLSAPASSTRTTTFLPGNAARSIVYASRCCSTVGAWLELRNRNSVRNSPTPSAPSATASAAPSGLPRLASSGTGVPSASAPSVIGAAAADERASARFWAWASSSAVGAVVTTPFAASTITVSPSARPAASAAPTTATMAFSRARIAVCEVGPPSVVTSASTLERSRRAVSAGARSFATSTNGCPGSGTPGAATPRSRAMTRWATSSRSAARSPR